jgi:tetratricopeptide (TPR) repeat protein
MQVLPIAQEAADPELLAIPAGAIGQAMAIQGHLGKATTLLGQAIPLFEKAANWPEWIQAMSFRGSAIAGMGDYAQGISEVKLALSRAKEINSLTGISVSNNCLGFAHFFGGGLSQAIKSAQAAVMAAEQSGDRIYVYVGYGLWGWAAARAGQLEAATACLARSQEVALELGGHIIMAYVFTTAKAEIAFYMKCFDEALGLAKQAVNIAQKMGGIWGEGIGRRVWGQALIALSSPNWEQAEIQMAESLRVLESGQNLIEMARTRVAWGAAYHDRRNFASARENWEQAAAQFQASGTTRELEAVCALLAES